MEKTKFSLKNYIKDLLQGADLYKKEQRFICVLLLCFVVSGISLPLVKEQIKPDIPDDSIDIPEIIVDETPDEDSDEEDEVSSTPTTPSTPSTKPSQKPPASSGNTDSNAGKTWVPPVYKTVHHEAVYETKTVEMCITEGCGKYFDTPAEFQAHKAAEGG